MSKINITCFITNYLLNIFLLDVFEKSSIFLENCKKPFSVATTIFEGTEASYDKSERNPFYRK